MNIFTLALYVFLIGWAGFMVWQLIRQTRAERAEKRRLNRLHGKNNGPFQPLHGRNSTNRPPRRWDR